jgi:hypothetical protein
MELEMREQMEKEVHNAKYHKIQQQNQQLINDKPTITKAAELRQKRKESEIHQPIQVEIRE